MGTIGSIALSDGGTPTITLTAATLIADAGVLAAINGNYLLSVSSGTVTEAQVAALDGGVGSHLIAGLAVSDSAAHVSAYLDTLQSLGGRVASIALTGVSPVVSLTAAQLISDSATVLKIGGSYGISVSGTATAAQATGANATLVGKLTAGFAISDSAAGVTSHLDALQTLAGGGAIASIALNDVSTPTISVTAATLVADALALGEITTSYNLSISSGTVTADQAVALPQGVTAHLFPGVHISDSVGDVVGDLNSLETVVSTIAAIALTDGSPSIEISAATLVADDAALTTISSAYSLSITSGTVTEAEAAALNASVTAHLTAGLTVHDTAAQVGANLDELGGLGNAVGAITLSDGTTPTITVTAATLAANAGALEKISGSYNLVASSGVVTAAQVSTIIADGLNSHISGTIAVTDTASRMMGSLDALESLASAGHLGTTTMAVSAPAYNATVAQVNSDSLAINDVMGATGANANAVLYVQGTSGGDTMDAGTLAHVTDISLGSNAATMSFVGSAASVSGTPDSLTLGGNAATVEYTMGSGVEVISGFQFGTDILNLALNGADPSDLVVSAVTVNSAAAIAINLTDDTTHGVILMTPGVSATSVSNDHLFAAGSHVLVA